MSFTEIFLIALGLSMDCFAISLSFGAGRKFTRKDMLIMSALFGLFQGFMPVVGWLAGRSVQLLISSVDHWIAFGLLAAIGLKMIWQSIREEKEKDTLDIRKPGVLISVSIATSIDALITGVGFGLIRTNILVASLVIAITAFLVSVTGARIGARSTFIPSRLAEIFGGMVLIGIGVKIVLDHLSII